MPNEQLINEIVKKCAGQISLFLGAGASVPLGLPSMLSFWKDVYGDNFLNLLKSSCKYYITTERKSLSQGQVDVNKQSVLLRLIQTASLGRDKISYDLEVIYDYIHNNPILTNDHQQRKNVKKFFHFYKTINDYPNDSRNIPDFLNYQTNYNNSNGKFTIWIDDVYECIENLRKKVDQAYLIDENHLAVNEAKKCFSFLPKLFSCKKPLIFTTNYDTIFEALDDSGKLNEIGYRLQSGSAQGQGRRFHFNLKNYLEEMNTPLYLFHLHGSVAWEETSEGIEDHFPRNHNNRSAIVEPVISKGLPNKEPFASLYKIFEKTLYENSILLVIGFSFRDDTIKKIVETRLNDPKDFHVICVAPVNKNNSDMDTHLVELAEKYPGKFIWLQEYFGKEEKNQLILQKVRELEPKK